MRGGGKKTRGVDLKINYNLRSGLKSGSHGLDDQQDTQVGTTETMAVSFENRDDPDYLRSMEDEIVKSRQAREEEKALLSSLMARLDKWEGKSSGVGRGILHTPLRTTEPPPGTRRGLSPADSIAGRLSSPLGAVGGEPAAADIINGPLTSVLQQLSIAIDPTPQSSVKGLLLRPEYYVQHKDKGVPVKSLDHSKMTYKELMSGMSRVLSHLSKTGGNVASYIDHLSFLTRKAGAYSFVDSAFVSYDRHVVDQFISGESDTFVVGDLFGVALYFHAGNVVQPVKPPFVKYNRGRGFRRGGSRPQWFDHDRQQTPDKESSASGNSLEGFPDDICYNFNYRSCTGSCKKSHICRLCRGNHKASSAQCASTKK